MLGRAEPTRATLAANFMRREQRGLSWTRVVAVPGLVVATLQVVGCGTPTGAQIPPTDPAVLSVQLGVPSGVVALPADPRDVVVRSGPDQLSIVTWGSSKCPTVPTRIQPIARNELHITMGSRASGGLASGAFCTTDLTGSTSAFQLPGSIDTGAPLVVVVSDGGNSTSVTIPPSF